MVSIEIAASVMIVVALAPLPVMRVRRRRALHRWQAAQWRRAQATE